MGVSFFFFYASFPSFPSVSVDVANMALSIWPQLPQKLLLFSGTNRSVEGAAGWAPPPEGGRFLQRLWFLTLNLSQVRAGVAPLWFTTVPKGSDSACFIQKPWPFLSLDHWCHTCRCLWRYLMQRFTCCIKTSLNTIIPFTRNKHVFIFEGTGKQYLYFKNVQMIRRRWGTKGREWDSSNLRNSWRLCQRKHLQEKRPNTESFSPRLYNYICTWKSIYVLGCRSGTFMVQGSSGVSRGIIISLLNLLASNLLCVELSSP